MAVTLAAIGLITAIITAILTFGSMVIERRQARWTTAEPFAAIAQMFSDITMNIIRSAIDDLQNRVRRLETMTMQVKDGAHDRHESPG